jgi:hypothetical protein
MMRLTTQNVALLEDNEDGEEQAPQLSKKQHIINRRGAFKWLPGQFTSLLCPHSSAHSSLLLNGCCPWILVRFMTFPLPHLISLLRWFVWGSLVAMLMAVLPLIQVDVNIFQATDDTLPVMDFYSTWALLIVSGFFFTVGSYAFVRAFEEPPKPPLFTWKHFETDELLGAWLFFLGATPAVPYTAIYFILDPSELLYLGALAAAVVFVLASLLFVFACYPSDKVPPPQPLSAPAHSSLRSTDRSSSHWLVSAAALTTPSSNTSRMIGWQGLGSSSTPPS